MGEGLMGLVLAAREYVMLNFNPPAHRANSVSDAFLRYIIRFHNMGDNFKPPVNSGYTPAASFQEMFSKFQSWMQGGGGGGGGGPLAKDEITDPDEFVAKY